MKIIKNRDNFLLKNQEGEYHISMKEFEKLGRKEAFKLAEKEIKKKNRSRYNEKEIDFKRAKGLGFCEYGIKDFCEKLELDIDGTYTINFLREKVTLDLLFEYPDEILKILSVKVLDKFGGILKILDIDADKNSIVNLALHEKVTTEKEQLEFSIYCNYSCLDSFEKSYPDDKRTRLAIEAKEKYLKDEISKSELDAVLSSARSAARGAAWEAASSAARSASESAAWSAARSAAWSAAWSSAVSSAESSAESSARSKDWDEDKAWDMARSEEWDVAWDEARSAQIESLKKIIRKRG